MAPPPGWLARDATRCPHECALPCLQVPSFAFLDDGPHLRASKKLCSFQGPTLKVIGADSVNLSLRRTGPSRKPRQENLFSGTNRPRKTTTLCRPRSEPGQAKAQRRPASLPCWPSARRPRFSQAFTSENLLRRPGLSAVEGPLQDPLPRSGAVALNPLSCVNNGPAAKAPEIGNVKQLHAINGFNKSLTRSSRRLDSKHHLHGPIV